MKKLFILQLIILFIIHTAYAQDSAKKAKPVKYNAPKYAAAKAPAYDTSKTKAALKPDVPTDKSLNGQYQYLLTKVYNYQQPLVGAFHKSIMDTLILARHALRDAQATVAGQTKTIDSLQTSIKASDATLAESNARVNSVDLFGMPVAKGTYNLLMWGLVILFGSIAVIVISRSGAYSREAKYRTQLYNELEEEYKNYKTKANEKEKKLARELQTERNRLDDMLGK